MAAMMLDRIQALRDDKAEQATRWLAGETVKEVRYMTQDEADELGWFEAAPVLVMESGLELVVWCDSEGNDPGCLSTTHPRIPVIPSI